ncbi:MAG: metallophosphoesterase [Clostridia bacterium]|nr:metallophosphoesterase [Clostridia bacterium]
MKFVFLRMISIFVAVCMLMLFAPAGPDSEPYGVKDPDACLMNLTVFSDIHVESNNYPRYRAIATCMKNAGQFQGKRDAILSLGDSTMNGQNIENMILHGTISLLLKNERIIPIAGNHDFGNGEGDFKRIQQRWYTYTEAFFGKKLTTPYYYDEVNGCRFIILANEQQNIDNMHMSDDQYAWLALQLEDAARTGMPTFVLAHYPPRMAKPINPDSQYDLCRMLAEFNREHDVFYLCGHLHSLPSATTFHAWSGFPEAYLPSLSFLNEAGEIFDGTGYGMQVELYADSVVFRVRNYYTGEWAELNGAPHEATYMLKNPIAVD